MSRTKPVQLALLTSSSEIPLTFGSGTENLAAFSFPRTQHQHVQIISAHDLLTLLLNGRGQSLGILFVGAVQEVGRQCLGSRLGSFVRLDVSLLVGANLLLHLNLLLPTLLGILLRPQSTQVLGLLGRIVALTSFLLSLAFIVIEALSVPRMGLLARFFICQVVQPRYLRCAKRLRVGGNMGSGHKRTAS